MNHIGAPVWRVLAACAVLGLDCHQLGDLTVEDVRGRCAGNVERSVRTAAVPCAHL